MGDSIPEWTAGRRNVLRVYDALHDLLTAVRPLERGQMIDQVRQELVIDSVGLDGLQASEFTVTLTFRRRAAPDQQLWMTVGLAVPIPVDREMTPREVGEVAWETLFPLIEACLSGKTNAAPETVMRWRD